MKNVLITGASGGIGQAIMREYIQNGDRVYAHYRSNEQSIKGLAAEFPSAEIIPVQADLSNKDELQSVYRFAQKVDTLILNAGSSFIGLLTDMDDEHIDKMINLHLSSSVKLARHYSKSMVQQKQGSIIVVSSVWGNSGASCEVVYSTVKGGLNAFVKSFAKELGPSGIRVNAVAPGYIATNMNAALSDEEEQGLIEEIPLGRSGNPEEVADVISFLDSEKSSYISGQIISVDGAWI
ncbi:elongation factor P 5-aminopentanone reductase [Guptibacillus algicola]|uniref:elongation factor P 5-aminopentanone reductase n=1 Tax=Guptibacillus algicola TaxID=225844 RepID=UPI001CD6EF70|nr:SDR family oxidoreductase [Alkalihalobacillus algicola]MCA0988106.1 SDR family oxidoreductase [Alkalihalobacillus algicola]